MTTIYFYGDSWTRGSELELFPEPQKVYSELIEEFLKIPTKNYSKNGSTQLEMMHQLLHSPIGKNDIAIFSLTSPSRRFFYGPDPRNQESPKIFYDGSLQTINDYNDVWMAGLAVYTLYTWCLQHSIKAYFFNLFTTSYNTEFHHLIWDSIPDDIWILPKDTCATREWYDPTWYKQWDTLRNNNYSAWLGTNNKQVQKYIRPCQNHPNPEGHKMIAQMVGEYLRSKLATTCYTSTS